MYKLASVFRFVFRLCAYTGQATRDGSQTLKLDCIQTSIVKTLWHYLQGELTITADMEVLGNALFLDAVPDTWLKRAYPSMYGLASWYTDLLLRVRELESWISDFQLPPSVWLGGFFNPQSFLTAIMQQVRARLRQYI